MALTDTLKLVITADGSSASKTFQKLGKDAETNLGKAEGGSSKLNAAMALLPAASLAAGAAVVAFGKKSVDTYMNVGTEVLKLQRYTGGTAEETSRLRFAMQQAGVDIDAAAKALGIFSKNIENSPQSFKAFNIATEDASGKTLSMHDILMNTAEQFQKMPNGAQKTAEALKLFGRAGADMIPFLNRGKTGIADLEAQTDKYGLTLSGKNLDDIKANKEAQRELTAAIQGLQVELGSKLLPTLTQATTKFTDLATAASGLPDKLSSVNDSVDGLWGSLVKTGLETNPLTGTMMDAAEAAGYFGGKSKKAAVDVDSIATSSHTSSAAVQEFLDKQKAAGVTYTSTGDALQAYKSNQDSATDSTDAATVAAKDLTSNLEKQDAALKDLNDTIHAAIDPLFGFQDAMDSTLQASKDMQQANLDVVVAQKAYNDAVKQSGDKSLAAMQAFKDLTDAQDKQSDASKKQERSALDVDTAMNTLAEKIKAQPGMLDEAKNSIDRWVQEGSIGTDQAKKYKDQLDLLAWTAASMNNTNVNMKVTVDAQQALAALKAISDAQQKLSDQQLNMGIDRTTGGGKVTGVRAYGGSVHRGETYIVGDRRGSDTAEYFTPNADGYITPSMGGGSSQPANVNVYVGGQQVEAVVTSRQRYDARGRRQ